MFHLPAKGSTLMTVTLIGKDNRPAGGGKRSHHSREVFGLTRAHYDARALKRAVGHMSVPPKPRGGEQHMC